MDVRKIISATEFWEYSSRFYAQNTNQAALLWLQDNAGLNVNGVLLLMYLDTKSVYISINEYSYLVGTIKSLDSLTSNFRKKRRAFKAIHSTKKMGEITTLDYQALLQQELDLEKQQQTMLVSKLFQLTKHKPKEVKRQDFGLIDLKAYIKSLTTSDRVFVVSELETHIDDLIAEQIKLANTFVQDVNE